MKCIIVFGLISLFFVSGCAWFEPEEEKTAQELARDGMDQFNRGRYDEAIASFEKLKDWYPFSKFVPFAELKIADANYNIKEYEEAVAAYEEFESLHPRNEAIPYVIYKIGLCYFQQIDTIDRDQTPANKALNTFTRLKKQFPEDAYAIKAEEHIKKCLKSLTGHELYVGLFYLKSKHYKAALHRFKSILTKYSDVGVHQKALQHIATCEALLKEQEGKKVSQQKIN
ncbi:MAG: outer membrane protein assembly factor BamD [Desulfobacterales bacterium]